MAQDQILPIMGQLKEKGVPYNFFDYDYFLNGMEMIKRKLKEYF